MNALRWERATRALASALLFAVVGTVALPAPATEYTMDRGTLWYSKSDLGWGVQLVPKDSGIFASLYVYDDQSNTATWYVAALAPQPTASIWTGNLYAAPGPWMGAAASNIEGLGLRQVGTMSWKDAGHQRPSVLTYTVDGHATSEQIVRGTGAIVDEYSGRYLATRTWTDSCGGSAEDTVEMVIAQSSPVIDIVWHEPAAGVDCRLAGNLRQKPDFGSVSGTYSCGNGSGKSQFSEMVVLAEKLTARWTSDADDKNCHVEGTLTAIRRR